MLVFSYLLLQWYIEFFDHIPLPVQVCLLGTDNVKRFILSMPSKCLFSLVNIKYLLFLYCIFKNTNYILYKKYNT